MRTFLVLVGFIFAVSRIFSSENEKLVFDPFKVSAFCPIKKVAEFQLSSGRKGAAAATDGDYIYIVGGEDALGSKVKMIERFNVRTHKSEFFADLQEPRAFHGAAIVGRKLYVFGGSDQPAAGGAPISGRDSDQPLRRDRDADTDPGLRMQNRSAPVSAGPYMNSVEYFDLDTRKRGYKNSMPTAKAFFGATVFDGKIYVIGGKKIKYGNRANTNSVEIFDPSSGSWTLGIPMPTPRQCMAVTVDDFIIVPGGYDGSKSLDVVEFFSPKEPAWKILPPLESQVSASALVRFGKYLLMFGNYVSPGKVVIYDLSNRRSQSFGFSYTPGRHAAAVTIGNRVYVIGGAVASRDSALDIIQVFASVNESGNH